MNTKKLYFLSTEALHVELGKNKKSFSLLGLYRAPQGNIGDFIDELNKWLNENKERDIIIAGDINIDIHNSNMMTNNYLNSLVLSGLEPMIQDFTREEVSGGKLTQSCIDHIHTRTKKGKSEGQVIAEKIADHYFIAVTISNFFSNGKQEYVENFFINNRKVDMYIEEVNWNEISKEQDPEKLYNSVIDIFNDTYEKSTKKII